MTADAVLKLAVALALDDRAVAAARRQALGRNVRRGARIHLVEERRGKLRGVAALASAHRVLPRTDVVRAARLPARGGRRCPANRLLLASDSPHCDDRASKHHEWTYRGRS